MGFFDRRYAALGWIVWRVLKRYARKRAKSAVPGSGSRGAKGPGMLALGALVAAVAGALWFWRRDDGGDDSPESVERP